MNLLPFSLFPTAIFLAGWLCCGLRVMAESEPVACRVEGDRIIFPAEAPQRATLTTVPAAEHAGGARRANGRLMWNEETTVRVYSPVAGRVTVINAKPGDVVELGAPLARLDSPDFGQAQADARKAAADLLLAERTLARVRELFEHGAAARKDLEAAENAHAGAQSERQRAAARLAMFGATDTEKVDGIFVLKAPLAGVVAEKNLNLGQELRPDLMLANAPQLFTPQFVISQPRQLWVTIDLAETDLAEVGSGANLRVRSRAFPGRVFDGKLENIGSSLDPATHTVRARGVVENPSRLLRAEMFVTVEFDAAGVAGVDVPAGAVFMKGDRQFVYIEEKPGTFLRCAVEAGGEQDGKILISRGLQAGQRVVTDGSLLLDGIRSDAGEK